MVVECPHCGEMVEVDESMTGSLVICPHCEGQFCGIEEEASEDLPQPAEPEMSEEEMTAARHKRMGKIALYVWAIGMIGFLFLLMIFALVDPSALVYVYNGTDSAVTLEVNGEALEQPLVSKQWKRTSMKMGVVRLKVLDGAGATLDERRVEIPSGLHSGIYPWVYNIGGSEVVVQKYVAVVGRSKTFQWRKDSASTSWTTAFFQADSFDRSKQFVEPWESLPEEIRRGAMEFSQTVLYRFEVVD